MRPTLLRIDQVEEATKLSRRTIHRYRVLGAFPAPRQIGMRAIAWLESDIEKWKESRPVLK